MEIGEQLKYIRKIRGFTQKEIGEKIGYSEAYICHFEKGNRKIKHEDIIKLEKLLSIKFNDVLSGIFESKADKLYEIMKLLFANPDNFEQIEKIWYRK